LIKKQENLISNRHLSNKIISRIRKDAKILTINYEIYLKIFDE